MSRRVPVLFLIALALAACHASRGPAAPAKFEGPAILRFVPADTPYVFGILEPMPPAVRARALDSRVLRAQLKLDEGASPMMTALAEEIVTLGDGDWWRGLGFAESGRMVVYGLDVWPVIRIEVAEPAKVRGLITRLTQKGGVTLEERRAEGRAYWRWQDGAFVVVIAVLDDELVVALQPTLDLERNLPYLLGARLPEKNVGHTGTLRGVIAAHGFHGFAAGYLDFRAITALPSLRDALGEARPECRAELDRLIALAPRLAVGYRRLDEAGFHAAIVLESPTIGRALASVTTAMPGMELPPRPGTLLIAGIAVDLDKTLAVLRDAAAAIERQPFTCPALASLNDGAMALRTALGGPTPPGLGGVRGMVVALDDLTADYQVRGAMTIVADDPLALTRLLLGALGVPAQVQGDGVPVELPLAQLGMNLGPAYLAVRGDRAVVTIGLDALTRAATVLGAPAPARSPLVLFAYDSAKLGSLLSMLGSPLPNLGTGVAGFALTASDQGVALELVGGWPTP